MYTLFEGFTSAIVRCVITDISLSHWGGGGVYAFYKYQISALDSTVVEAQKMLSSHGGFLTIAMYHHKETI